MVCQVFLRYFHADQLNAAVQIVVNRVIICQSCVRRFAALLRYRRAVDSMQSYRLESSSFAQNVENCSNAAFDAQRRHIAEDRDRADGTAKAQQLLLAAELNKLLYQPKIPSKPVQRSTPHQNSDVAASNNIGTAAADDHAAGKL